MPPQWAWASPDTFRKFTVVLVGFFPKTSHFPEIVTGQTTPNQNKLAPQPIKLAFISNDFSFDLVVGPLP